MANAPDLEMGLELFYGAFLDLTTCRIGMGDGPISWLAVDEYCHSLGLDAEATSDMHYYIGKMDYAYLKQQEAARKKGN